MITTPPLKITDVPQTIPPVGLKLSKRNLSSGDCGDSNCLGHGEFGSPFDCDCEPDPACEPYPDECW